MSMWWFQAGATHLLVTTSGSPPSDAVDTDAATVSEGTAAATILAGAVESATLNESATAQLLAVAVDSATLSDDGLAGLVSQNVVGVDTGTLSESLTLTADVARTDSAAVSDAATSALAGVVTDQATLSEAAIVAAFLASLDSAILSEVASPSLIASGDITATDQATLSEAATAALLAAASDSHSLTESGFTFAEIMGTDALLFGEASLVEAPFTGTGSGEVSISPRIVKSIGASAATVTMDSTYITFDSTLTTLDGGYLGELATEIIRRRVQVDDAGPEARIEADALVGV